jgi:hypothetical protein
MKTIGIGTHIGKGIFSWVSYWANSGLFLFFGEVSKITGGRLYNQVRDSVDYLTVGGSVGSYTFQAPVNATYKAADTDYIWFKTDETPRTTTEAELIGYDLQRTPVKYDDASPNSIRWIGILKLATTLTATQRNNLFKSFYLPIMWDDSWNDYGHSKENRPLTEQVLWTPEPMAPVNIVLALISGGVRVSFTDNSGGTAQHEIYGKIDAGAYTLVTTLDAADVSFDDIRTPEDLMTYKVRAKAGTLYPSYSDYCTEDDIVMLGANLVPAASSSFVTNGTAYWTWFGGTVVWNSGTHDVTVTQSAGTAIFGICYKDTILTVGKKYLVRFDAKSANTTSKLTEDNAAGTYMTDVNQTILSAIYQNFRFIGVQPANGFLTLRTKDIVTGSIINLDNIKAQEVL